MAALTDEVQLTIDERAPLIWGEYTTEADTYFRGALVCWDTTNDVAVVVSADADFFLGVCLRTKTTVAGDLRIEVATIIRFLVTAATMIDSSVGKIMYPLATSDNPADIIVGADAGGSAGTVSALGWCDQITDNSGTTGWVNTMVKHLENS